MQEEHQSSGKFKKQGISFRIHICEQPTAYTDKNFNSNKSAACNFTVERFLTEEKYRKPRIPKDPRCPECGSRGVKGKQA